MEKIFEQTYNYACILPLRNYSRLSDKPEIVELSKKKKNNSDDFFGLFESNSTKSGDLDGYAGVCPNFFEKSKSFYINYISLEEHQSTLKRKSKVKFFYNDKSKKDEKVYLLSPSKNRPYFFTTKDRHIKRYFSDPFTKMEINTFKRVIYKDEDKLVIKILHKEKYRTVNWKFFKEHTYSDAICFNLKTGNFKVIDQNMSTTRSGRLPARFRTNSFQQLKNLVESKNSFYIGDRANGTNNRIMTEFKQAFNDEEFLDAINKSLFRNPVHKLTKENIFDTIVSDFILKRNVKVPNDYMKYIMNYFPKVRPLKKNDNKLIQGILDMFKIKTKHNVKLLHEHPEINIVPLVHTCYLFGKDFYHYVSKIPYQFFVDGHTGSKYDISDDFTTQIHLTKEEKDNMLNVIIDSCNKNNRRDGLEILIKDHIDMLKKVREYFPDTKFYPRTKAEFNQQHGELSSILVKVRKGWTTEYQFDDKMLDDVEKEIVALKDENSLITLKPFILKREDDYVEEGSFMHHCVAGYVNSDRSIIISLRTLNGEDRVTCEFNIQTGKVIQKRHFCNHTPPEHFVDGLDQLEEKVLKYARWGMLNWKEKKKVPIKINGVEVKIENPKPKTFEDVLIEDHLL